MARRVLVVTTEPIERDVLDARVGEHLGDERPEIKVVAPAAKISRLDWLTNDEDEARAQAAAVAEQSAAELPDAAPAEAEVGDTDPVQAIEDALREWPADEVLVVTPPDEEATWLEQGAGEEAQSRFGVPVVQLRLGRG